MTVGLGNILKDSHEQQNVNNNIINYNWQWITYFYMKLIGAPNCPKFKIFDDKHQTQTQNFISTRNYIHTIKH